VLAAATPVNKSTAPVGTPATSDAKPRYASYVLLQVVTKLQFLARDSIYSIARYMPSPVRPSVRLSVRHTGG